MNHVPETACSPSALLSAAEQRWRAWFGQRSVPVLAGLAPLDDEEKTLLLGAIRQTVIGDAARLCRLIEMYPAAMVVCLSRVAMECYDGNFWRNFGDHLQADFPPPLRPRLAGAFRRARRSVCSVYVSACFGAMPHAGEFLFQAALPLHHCAVFAQSLRAALDELGLPAPDDEDAVSDITATMLARTELHGRGLVIQILESSLGTLLVQSALRAVTELAFDECNPVLGHELRKQFEARPIRGGGRSLRRPFIRLAEDRTSLELICPGPGSMSDWDGGCVWTINGHREHASSEEDLVVPVEMPASIKVELASLDGYTRFRWTFDFSVTDWALFDLRTGRWKRVAATDGTVTLAAGDYWLVHASDHAVSDSLSCCEWWGGDLTTSQIRVRPTQQQELSDENGDSVVTFTVEPRPWLETLDGFVTADGIRVHYAWATLPCVWLPEDEARDAEWTLDVSTGHCRESWALTPTGDAISGFFACERIGGEFLAKLGPGMCILECRLLSGGRLVSEQRMYFWQGLLQFEPIRFTFAQLPANLVSARCVGFDLADVSPVQTPSRERMLAFKCRSEHEETVVLRWLREGMSLESGDRIQGRRTVFQPHRVGECFAADAHSRRWLRLTANGWDRAVLCLCGQPHQTKQSSDGAVIFEVSLAQLATLKPDGGVISLKLGQLETQVARFRRPLIPLNVSLEEKHGYRSWVARFKEPVRWVRPVVMDLVTGEQMTWPGSEFCSSGHALFTHERLPQIEFSAISTAGHTPEKSWPVSLDLPEDGWPPGVWCVEMEIRPDSNSEWQPLLDERAGRFPLLLVSAPTAFPASYRAHCIWRVFGAGMANENVPTALPSADGHAAEVGAMLSEINRWFARRISDKAWDQFEPFRSLRVEMLKQVGYFLSQGEAALAQVLVTALNEESEAASTRSLVADVPQLLALKSEHFASLADRDTVRAALSWCARINSAEHIMDTQGACDLCDVTDDKVRFLPETRPALDILGYCATGAFDFCRYFGALERAVQQEPPARDIFPPLSASHFVWAMKAARRRHESSADNEGWGEYTGLYDRAGEWAGKIHEFTAYYSKLMPQDRWRKAWPEITVPGDHFITSVVRFASVYALAARLGGMGVLNFFGALRWLHGQHERGVASKGCMTLLCQAPELLGFFLMFWEFTIKTRRHD